MRHPEKNTLLVLLFFFKESMKKAWESIIFLLSGKKGTEGGILWSILHHIFIIGPKSWKKNPRAVKIGKALFIPFVFLFSQSSPPGNSSRK